jgi:glycerol-3-phosphate acyltransferase PlsY
MEERKKNRKLNIKILKRKRDRYVFTDKKHPDKGIMSFVFGVLSVCTICYSIFLSYKNGGEAKGSYGAAVLLCLIYSLVGLVLGIISRMEKDIFKLFPTAGIVLNVVALLCIGVLLYLAFV